MKTVSFTENEIDYIKELYKQELERLQERTNVVAALLEKIKLMGNSIETATVQQKSTKVEIALKRKKDNVLIDSAQSFEKEINAVLKSPKSQAIKEDVAIKGKKRGPKAKEKSAKPVKAVKVTNVEKVNETKGKPGRKKSADSKRSIWTAAILDIIGKNEKMIPSSIIVDEIMKSQKIPASDITKTRSMVGGSLIDLKKESKIKTVPNPGKKGELYGLSEWFDAKGVLIDKSKQ